MKLVVVESPTKAKTLSKLLGKDYQIKASMGHIRDLPKKGLGVDVDHDFEPEYVIPEKSKKVLADLRAGLKNADSVILATDPDREGEAIAWHLEQILSGEAKEVIDTPKKKGRSKKAGAKGKAGKTGSDKTEGGKTEKTENETKDETKEEINEPVETIAFDVDKSKFQRVVFHELTKAAVEEAFSHPTTLDLDLVDAQQARRVLDRLVGYKLSPLLWKKVRYGLSAGRVQSVAVRLVVERERERQLFKSEEYWSIEGEFKNGSDDILKAELIEKNEKKLEIKSLDEAKNIENDLKNDSFEVVSIKISERQRKPYAPFKTSTLQQAASNVFGFTAKRTMNAAQKLFEQGFITYHRTDSLNLSPAFVGGARSYIEAKMGKKYLPENFVFYKTNAKSAQEAHEAIRPTNLNNEPSFIESHVKSQRMADDEVKIYSLIWKRAVECQMLPAVYDQTVIDIGSKKGYMFRANGSVIKFDGWLYVEKYLGIEEDPESLNELPKLKEGESVKLLKLNSEQHFTQPPARYSDATLIKTLEDLEIGRPSTYAPTITTIQTRGYVVKDGKYFVPTDVAYVVNDLLVKYFSHVVDYEFTAEVEKDLDKIAEGQKEWVPVIRQFYTPFEKTVKEKDKELNKMDITNLGESAETCPECGKPLIFKLGKYGKFLSCSGFPVCNYAKPVEDPNANGGVKQDFGKCPNCEDGIFILKQGKFGKFLACSNYPKCKTTQTYLEKIGMKCPKCLDGEVIIKKTKGRVFYGCSKYPECNYSSWKNPLKIDKTA